MSETRSPGQIKRKPCWNSRGHIFEVIIMNLAQNVCLDDLFHLGQFLSNYWSFRVILKKASFQELSSFQTDLPASVAQLDPRPTGDQEAADLTPAG